jgi:hypothetical protein
LFVICTHADDDEGLEASVKRQAPVLSVAYWNIAIDMLGLTAVRRKHEKGLQW